MYSASQSFRTAILVLFCGISSQAAFPQAINFTRYEADAGPRPYSPFARPSCARDATTVGAEATPGNGAANDAFVPCDATPNNVMPVNPCSPSSLGRSGCNAPKDLVAGDLGPLGKAGQSILRAREKVLEILQTENGCTDWYRTKDPNPAATFRTLIFTVDDKGDAYVKRFREVGQVEVFRSPYVARVYQGDGSFATITLNAKGGFFHGMSMVMDVPQDGGPWTYEGYRVLRVGPYAGSTLNAQVATLLHEFGHLLDLLPIDESDQDGKSVQNTYEVLRYCRPEVESKLKRGTFAARR
jgi:hypothetical protein